MNGLYVVAGATGAIGRRLCRNIVERGGTPVLVGRSADKLQQLNSEHLGGSCPIISDVDYRQPEEAGKILASELKGVLSQHPQPLNGIAYCVGSITIKSLRGCRTDDFLESYRVNVLGAAETVKAALPGLKKAGAPGGSVVLFSSVAARHGLANHAVVGSSKAAVEGLAVALAAELAPAVRVNCVAPSLTGGGSEMARGFTDNEKVAAAVAAAHPLPRLGTPADSADAATFLLSPQSSWTTGIILPVDGGRSSILK